MYRIKIFADIPFVRYVLGLKQYKEGVGVCLVDVYISRFNVINLYHVGVFRDKRLKLRGLEVKVLLYVYKYLRCVKDLVFNRGKDVILGIGFG